MPFDINTIPEESRADFQQFLNDKIQEENSALASNRDAILQEKADLEAAAAANNQTIEQYKNSFGEKTPEEIQALLKAQKEGDVAALIGEGKFKEAAQRLADDQISEIQRTQKVKEAAAAKELKEWKEKYESADSQNKAIRLGKTGADYYLTQDDCRPEAVPKIEREVIENFSVDKNGNPVMYQKDGKTVRLNERTGEPYSINDFIDNDLRVASPYYFKDKQGGGAPGSKGTGASGLDYGLGITSRSKATPLQRTAHHTKAREAGLDPVEEWGKLPA